MKRKFYVLEKKGAFLIIINDKSTISLSIGDEEVILRMTLSKPSPVVILKESLRDGLKEVSLKEFLKIGIKIGKRGEFSKFQEIMDACEDFKDEEKKLKSEKGE